MLQIQPFFNQKNAYEALAKSQGLFFEVLELSFDPVHPDAADWYKQNRKTTSLHGAFMDVNPGSGDPLIRRISEQRYIESCEHAVSIGTQNVVFHSTCCPFLRGGYLHTWADRCASFYMKLAEQYNTLQFYIENSSDIDPVPMYTLMQRISARNVHICLDIGHIHYSGTPIEKWFDMLGCYTGYLHLSDNMGAYDDHLPLGDGSVDWEKADALCRFLPPDTPITLEVGDLDGIRKSLEFLCTHGFFGGVK